MVCLRSGFCYKTDELWLWLVTKDTEMAAQRHLRLAKQKHNARKNYKNVVSTLPRGLIFFRIDLVIGAILAPFRRLHQCSASRPLVQLIGEIFVGTRSWKDRRRRAVRGRHFFNCFVQIPSIPTDIRPGLEPTPSVNIPYISRGVFSFFREINIFGHTNGPRQWLYITCFNLELVLYFTPAVSPPPAAANGVFPSQKLQKYNSSPIGEKKSEKREPWRDLYGISLQSVLLQVIFMTYKTSIRSSLSLNFAGTEAADFTLFAAPRGH